MPTPTGSSPHTFSARTGNTSIDSLMSGVKWSSGSISYSFPHAGSYWSQDATTGYGLLSGTSGTREPWSDYDLLSPHEMGAVRTALKSWGSVAKLSFNEVAETSTNVGDLRFAYSDALADAQAWAYYPSEGSKAGDIWFNTLESSFSKPWTPGSYEYSTVIHEIGHALGLKHPFDDTQYNSQELALDFDSCSYTVMSYSADPGVQGTRFSYEPTTPMVLDVAAIQSLYGANTAQNSGNNQYVFYQFGTYHQTVWDAGGIDTFVYESTTGGEINLNAGLSGGSDMGSAVYVQDSSRNNLYDVYSIYIANGVVIENATGGSGNDWIIGNRGNNVLNGRSGNDTVSYQAGVSSGVTVNLGSTSAQNTVGAGIDTVLGFENLTGSRFNDTLTGSNGNNTLNGGLGNDRLNGGLGNDRLNGGAGIDTASYAGSASGVTVSLGLTTAQNTIGAGVDTLLGIENLMGSSFNDTLMGNAGNNVLNGGSGIDNVSYAGSAAGVTVYLGSTSAQNTVGAGIDTVLGFENLTGSRFNDTLTGSNGNNTLNGGLGNDRLNGGLGNDWLNGGAGVDTASYAGSASRVTVNLNSTSAQNTAGAGSDTLLGIENLMGSSFNDALTGSASSNVLNGGSGNDWLSGGSGNDGLIGGLGNDGLTGGLGNDTLTGGAGIDYFLFNTPLNGTNNKDLITDFNVTDDTIRLENSVMTSIGLSTGTLAASEFFVGTAAHDADDSIIYNKWTGALYYDVDGTGANAAVQIATIGTASHASLTNADFWVV